MQWNNPYDRKNFNRPEPNPQEQGTVVLWTALFVFGLCLAFASSAPHELFAAALSSLLVFAALTSALAALMRGETVVLDRLTHWDATAAFMAMSILLSWLVDPEAVRAYLDAQGQHMAAEPR